MASAQGRDIAESDVRIRSYLIWEREGRPEGRELDHWLTALAELRAEARTAARVPETPASAKLPAKLEAEAGSAEKPKKRSGRPKAPGTATEAKPAKSARAPRKAAAPRNPSGKGGKS